MYFRLNETRMQTVAFYPSDWNGHICMRIELYGCVIGIYTSIDDWVYENGVKNLREMFHISL